jgi:outer membrane protein assembly factor BamB
LTFCAVPALAGTHPDKDPRAALPKTLPPWWDEIPAFEVKDGVAFGEARGQLEQFVANLMKQQEVKGWSWLGPFDNRDGIGMQTVFPPEADYLKKGFDAGAEYQGVSGKVKWSKPEAGLPPNNAPNITMYAFTRVEWPKDEKVPLWYFSDDGSICWIARKEAHRRQEYGEDYPIVALQKGVNEFFVKVVNGGGPWDLKLACLKVSPPRCRFKAVAILLSRLVAKPEEQTPLLCELLHNSAQMNERELFRHYALEGARVLNRSGKKRNEFLREMLVAVERYNLSEMGPQLLEALTPNEMEEETWMRYARAYQLTGNFDKALESYRAIFDSPAYTAPGRLQAGRELTELLASLGDYQGASQVLAALLKSHPNPNKQEDEALKAARLAAESARDFTAVLDLDEDHERIAEQADRLIASEREREAFRLIQSSLLNAGLKCVRTSADPQVFVGAAEVYRAELQKHQAAYTKFLEGTQARRWEEWERTRREELLWSSLAESFDPASSARMCVGAAQWEMERGQAEGARAWLQRAQRLASEGLQGEAVQKLLNFATRAEAAAKAAEPARVKGWRVWETPLQYSHFHAQARTRQPKLRLETLYVPAERDGVFYFGNEDTVRAVCEGRVLWQWQSGGLSCRELYETPTVLLGARQQPEADDLRIYARVLLPDAAGLDGRFGVVCLDRFTGQELWRSDDEAFNRAHVNGAPVLDGDHVLVTAVTRPMLTGSDRAELSLFALDARTGAVRKRLFLCTNRDTLENVNPAFHIGAPGRDDEAFYVDTGLGAMACIERATLAVRWIRSYPRLRLGQELFRTRLMNRVNCSPAAGKDVVAFAPADSAFVFFLEPRTGKVLARLSSLVFRALAGLRGEAAVFEGAGLVAVQARDGKKLWQTPALAAVRGTWLGEDWVLAAFDNGTQNLRLKGGAAGPETDLEPGTIPLAAGRDWLAALKGRQYRIHDNRPRTEAALPRLTPVKPMRVSASALPARETGRIPYPGATVAGKWDRFVIFRSLAWLGLYDTREHREVWRYVNSNGRVHCCPPYLIHVDGSQRALQVLDLASGREVFTWQVERFVGDPAVGAPTIHGDLLAFHYQNRDWATGREFFVYVYNLKDQSLVKKEVCEVPTVPQVGIWKDEFYLLGPLHEWDRENHPFYVVKPLSGGKPARSELFAGRWSDGDWDEQAGELLIASPDRNQICIAQPPFKKENVRVLTLPRGTKPDHGARSQFKGLIFYNDAYVVCPGFWDPRRVVDRKTLQLVEVPRGGKQFVQPMPFGKDGLVYCGSPTQGANPEKPKGGFRTPPHRILYYQQQNGEPVALGKIEIPGVKEQVNEEEYRWLTQRLDAIYIQCEGDAAYVFLGVPHYADWESHVVDFPLTVYRARPKEGKLEGPFLLPLGYTARMTPCGDEVAADTLNGIVFFQLVSGAAQERKAVPIAFQPGDEMFQLDGLLNEWDPKDFTGLDGGAKLAARWDGAQLRLAGMLPGREGCRPAIEDLKLALTPMSQGFYQGWPLPWMRRQVRLTTLPNDESGFRYTSGADGSLRFEAVLPFEWLYRNHERGAREFNLLRPRSFLLRLDFLAPGVEEGVLATLGGSATDPRPYEMVPLRPAALEAAAAIKPFLGEGALRAGEMYAEWRAEAGLVFLLRPMAKERHVTWSIKERITRHSAVDFGRLFTVNERAFSIRVLGPDGAPLAERTVKAGAAPEAFKVPLGALAGQEGWIRAEMTPARDGYVAIQRIEFVK